MVLLDDLDQGALVDVEAKPDTTVYISARLKLKLTNGDVWRRIEVDGEIQIY